MYVSEEEESMRSVIVHYFSHSEFEKLSGETSTRRGTKPK